MSLTNKIINFTPTGTQTTRENSFAPLTPNEIIEEVHNAYELGITVTHIHARDPKDLSNTYRKDVYGEIITGIRKHCPGLSICVSLTGRLHPEFEKRSEVLELYPDMGSLTMSSLNFPKSSSVNEPDMILKLIQKMDDYGVIPEIECFDSGMINYTNYLISKNILKGPHYINVILGNIYNAQSDISSISSIVNNLPKNSMTCLGGIGKDQLKCNMMGLLYFDGLRIGLEDNLYYRNKEKTTNIDLLKRIHTIMNEMDLNVLSPLEFKKLGYGNKTNNHT
jgi:3-keto-5-aminohexanoate cleavage enzyme